MVTLLLLLFSCSHLNADIDAGKPEIFFTEDGKKKVEESLKNLEQNIETVTNNIATSEKNLKTLSAELEDLNRLEKEYSLLREKSMAYLADATKKFQKNELNIQDITRKIEKFRKTKSLELEENQAQYIQMEKQKAEYERWKEDALLKINKVKELGPGLEDGLSQIKLKYGSIQKQIDAWVHNQKQFQNLLEQFEIRKKELSFYVKPKEKGKEGLKK